MKRILCFILSFVLLIIHIPSLSYTAYASTSGEWEYEHGGGTGFTGIRITGYNGSDTEIIVPDAIGNVRVTEIANDVFTDNDTITSIILPDSLVSIWSTVFKNCTSLKYISIPDSVSDLGSSTFENCSQLESINLPKSLKYIGYNLFKNCTSLNSVIVPEEVQTIGDNAFYGCTNLHEVIFNDNLKTIHGGAFANCINLESIEIPSSVTDIYGDAFNGCSKLNILTFNSTVNIGRNAFRNTAYYYDSSNWENGALYLSGCLVNTNDSITTDFKIKDGTVIIGSGAFIGNQNLHSISIPESVERIGGSAFKDCTSLSEIILSESISEIGSEAFNNTAYYNNNDNWENGVLYIGSCLIKADESIVEDTTIKNGTTIISAGAFSRCNNIKQIEIPDGVKYINSYAFHSCSSLESIVFPSSIEKIGDVITDTILSPNLSLICVNLKNINQYSIYQHVFSNFDDVVEDIYIDGKKITDLKLPSGMEEIGLNIFIDCNTIQSVTVPETAETVEDCSLFLSKTSNEITVPCDIADVSWGQKLNVYKFKNINKVVFSKGLFSNDIKTIPKAFTASPIKEMVICEGIERLSFDDDPNFIYRNYLEKVTLPESLTFIGNMAFQFCHKLTEINFPSGLQTIGPWAFSGTSISDISLSDGLVTIGKCAFELTKITKLNIPGSVSEVSSRAFDCCSNLNSVVFNEGVTTIGDRTFYSCQNLKRIDIPKSVTKVECEAFIWCSSLEDVYYAGTMEEWNAIDIDRTKIENKQPSYWMGNEPLINARVHCTDGVLNCEHQWDEGIITTTATCKEEGVKTFTCSVCGDVYTVPIEKLNHTPLEAVKENEKAATCTAKGLYDSVVYCSECHTELNRETKTLDLLTHTPATDEAVAPTCTEQGLTEGSHCSVCGEVLVAQKEIAPLGHKWDSGKVTKKATPTATGIKTYTCTVCGNQKIEKLAKLPKKPNTLKVKTKEPTVKFAKLKKKNQTIALKKAMTVSNAQGTVTYKLSSAKKGKKNFKKYFTVAKNGKITVKKGLKKGTYTVKIKVTAAGNTEYKAKTKTVTVKIKVK